MNCHYCHNLCKNNVSSWICDICDAEFFDGHTNLSTRINGKEYTLQMIFKPQPNKPPARIICPLPSYTLARIDVPGAPGIINLSAIPQNVTPDNVNEKIKLYLLFS